MTPDELREQLIAERFGLPVPEWKPPVEHVLAGTQRVDVLDREERRPAS